MAQPSITQIRAAFAVGSLGKNREKFEVVDAGVLNLGSGRLTVIDPGFMHPVRISRLVKVAPSGDARVRLAVVRHGENAGMPALLALTFSDLQNAVRLELAQRTNIRPGEEQGYVSADSGEICIIDEKRIPQGDERALFLFGHNLIKQRNAKKLAEIFAAHEAVVAKSGNGDGAYPCYWLLDGKGGAVGLLIDFENWNRGR